MARSFDRRVSSTTRACWPQIDWDAVDANTAAVDARRKEDDLSLDCMCKNNDPECETCWQKWVYTSLDTKPGVTEAFTPKQVTDVTSDFAMDVRYRFEECEELLLRKHKDYGPANIANAPGGPLNGLRVRMHDKLARINHLIDTGATPENESLRDSLADLCNYSLIGLMVIDERWPTK